MAALGTVKSTLQALSSPASSEHQLQILKRIKTDLTGHLSRKAEFIQHGLVTQLADVLAEVTTKQDLDTDNCVQLDEQSELTLLHVAQVLYVICNEGPSFVDALLATDILQYLVSLLLVPLSSRTSLAVLRCLNAVADNLPPSSPGHWAQSGRLAELLYSPRYIRWFEHIIGNVGHTTSSQQACDACIALLCKTATLDTQRRVLVDCGVLDILSTRLASFVVAEGLVPPNSASAVDDPTISTSFPLPAPASAHLSPVLEALCVLTGGSRSRTKVFLANATLGSVLPDLPHNFSPSDIRRAPWGANYFSGVAVPRTRLQSPFDPLLPTAPDAEKSPTAQSGFPPLSSAISMPKRRPSFLPTSNKVPGFSFSQNSPDHSRESAVISLLLYVVRESHGRRRLLAAKLLVNFHSLRLIKQSRASSLASLLVPLLTRMMDVEQAQLDKSRCAQGSFLCTGSHYTSAVPMVLATLIVDDLHMQRVAVEGKAITRLSAALKSTFDVPTGSKLVPWQPRKQDRMETDSTYEAACLGSIAPTRRERRNMAYREGCLKALAAIAPFEEDYRAQICNEGALPYIIQALDPYQAPTNTEDGPKSTGNSGPVILAACAAVRALARSVRALRTKLIEAEVAKPILSLMNLTNPELRIAATKVLTNLAMDFSAVKESVGETAVIRKLCEQAHSANARLRHESLWALKQLVLNAPKKLKLEVVDELGCSWIKLLIKTDPVDIPTGEVIGLVERDYPPNTIPMQSLYPVNSHHDAVMAGESESDNDSEEITNGGCESATSDQDDFDTRHTVEDDTQIQSQLLDLLRNLFCGENASELVRYILDEMGQDDFFRIMLDRLRPRILAGPTRKENYTTPPSSMIATKVLIVIVHIAACDQMWRNIIASQYALLKQVLTFCAHPDREIRSTCCWIAINLTYEDDASDRAGCKRRAIDLQKIGFVPHLRKLETDSDLDVRERAKAALHLLTDLKLAG